MRRAVRALDSGYWHGRSDGPEVLRSTINVQRWRHATSLSPPPPATPLYSGLPAAMEALNLLVRCSKRSVAQPRSDCAFLIGSHRDNNPNGTSTVFPSRTCHLELSSIGEEPSLNKIFLHTVPRSRSASNGTMRRSHAYKGSSPKLAEPRSRRTAEFAH